MSEVDDEGLDEGMRAKACMLIRPDLQTVVWRAIVDR